jgi:Fe2+ transport system protein B
LCSGMQLAGLPGHKVVPAHGSFGGERMLLLGVGCRVVAIRQGATAATSSSQ